MTFIVTTGLVLSTLHLVTSNSLFGSCISIHFLVRFQVISNTFVFIFFKEMAANPTAILTEISWLRSQYNVTRMISNKNNDSREMLDHHRGPSRKENEKERKSCHLDIFHISAHQTW